MKYISIFIMFSIMLALVGCGKDVERKIEVTIKDSVNKHKSLPKGETIYECPADDMLHINISSKNDSVKNILEIIKKVHNIKISYPDSFKKKVISINKKNITVENLIDEIATMSETSVDYLNDKYVFK